MKKSHYKSNTQKEITNFFKTQTKHPNKEDPAQIPNLRGSTKGILLDRAVDIWKSKRLKTQKTTRYRQNSSKDSDHPESTEEKTYKDSLLGRGGKAPTPTYAGPAGTFNVKTPALGLPTTALIYPNLLVFFP